MMHEPTIQEQFSLQGKTAIVTGGTGYLGQAIARALAEAGANVVVTSRERERAEAAAKNLPTVGQARHAGYRLDQMAPDTLEADFASIVGEFKRVDVLVNNGNEHVRLDHTNIDAENFNRQLANATGYFLLARLVRNGAVEQGTQASVIMLGSMYGMVASYPDAYEGITYASPVAYHVQKGGILQMTRHLAVYWARDRVRVNALSPGPFPAPTVDQRMVDRLCAKSPMKRMGLPHELKGAVVFLASEASSYVTGQNLVVDGGWTAW